MSNTWLQIMVDLATILCADPTSARQSTGANSRYEWSLHRHYYVLLCTSS